MESYERWKTIFVIVYVVIAIVNKSEVDSN